MAVSCKNDMSGHRWSWDDRCVLCLCTREEYEDNLRPICHPTGHALIVVYRKFAHGWNATVPVAVNALANRLFLPYR